MASPLVALRSGAFGGFKRCQFLESGRPGRLEAHSPSPAERTARVSFLSASQPWRASSPWASPVVAVAMLVRSNGSPCDLSLSPLRPGRSHNTTQFSGTSSLQKTVRCTKMKIEQGISQRRSWEHREHWRERRERAYQPRGQATGGRERVEGLHAERSARRRRRIRSVDSGDERWRTRTPRTSR